VGQRNSGDRDMKILFKEKEERRFYWKIKRK
jgi:hypothetical protein